MFHTKTTAAAEATHDVVVMDPPELVALSVLQLDLDAPAVGWDAYLTGRGIPIVLDHIGRSAISSVDARQLLEEKREAEARAREKREAAEQQAVEADRVRRAQIWRGLPADHLPVGVSAATAMLAASRDARPKRMTPLQETLSSNTLTYHPLHSAPDEDAS
jgi:hypothetical protein